MFQICAALKQNSIVPAKMNNCISQRQARESEFAVSRGGLNQESDHNKHDGSGQSGHKPGKPGPAQEKH
jgi:hypothetical protein